MNPEQQRTAIAKWCGLEPQDIPIVPNKANIHGWFTPDGKVAFHNAYPHGQNVKVIPDYLNDLNAIHEAESQLEPGHDGSQQGNYQEALWNIVNPGVIFNPRKLHDVSYLQRFIGATAAQRAEALLLTIEPYPSTL